MIIQIFYLTLFLFFVNAYTYLYNFIFLATSSRAIYDLLKESATFFYNNIISTSGKVFLNKPRKSEENFEEKILENPDKIDIIISNHTTILDFMILSYIKDIHINFVFKNELIYIPGFGAPLYFDSDIKLQRNWEEDKLKMTKQLDIIQESSQSNKKQVIVIFPEGTRINDKNLKEGQEFSKNNNLPIYDDLLVPRTKGLELITSYLKSKNTLGRIWDTTFIYQNNKKFSFFNNISKTGNIYLIAREVFINNEIPFKNWLINIWSQKQNIIHNYNNYEYDEFKPENKGSNWMVIFFTIIFFIMLLDNSYGRIFLLISFIVTYLFVIFKL